MTRKLILMGIVAMGLLVSSLGTSNAHAGWYYNYYYNQWVYYR